MKKTFYFSLSLLLILLMMACGQKKEEVLHMIQAPHGIITGNSATGYILSLKEMHDTVIWFTNRPNRVAGSLQIKNFLRVWSKGKDSFEKDPPNAIVIIGNSEPIVVEMILIHSNKNKAKFALKKLEGQESKLIDKRGPTIIFIDDLPRCEILDIAEA